MIRFQIRRSSGAQPFYFRVRGSNGKILTRSETYTSKAKVKQAIAQFTRRMVDGSYAVEDHT